MSKKFIIGNWKMLPTTWAEAEGLLEATDGFLGTLNERKELSLVVCPPFIFLEDVSKMLQTSHLKHEAELGAQDISTEDSGALTGEISGPMLAKLNVQYVIVGHSERRWKLGESDEIVNKKLKAVLRNGMTPVVCIGERKREGGWQKELQEQVLTTFANIPTSQVGKCMIAYEPVWAISTNPGAKSDSSENAAQSVKIIQKVFHSTFDIRHSTFLYGGSITPDNAEEFLRHESFSGVLIGGASVRKDDFVKILRAGIRNLE